MIIRILSILVLFASTTVHASQFVDGPAQSIELDMADCFADKDCAAQADRLIPLFAKNRGMQVSEVRETLENCLSGVTNMGFCAQYEVFAVTDELAEIVRVRLQKHPNDKAARPLRDMKAWSRRLENACFRKVDKEMPDASGIYYGEQVVICELYRVIEVVKELR
jgi:hypothetical protein